MSRSYSYKQIDFNQKLNNLTNQINKKNDDLIYFIYKNYILKNYNDNLINSKNQLKKLQFDINNYKSFKSFISQNIRQD